MQYYNGKYYPEAPSSNVLGDIAFSPCSGHNWSQASLISDSYYNHYPHATQIAGQVYRNPTYSYHMADQYSEIQAGTSAMAPGQSLPTQRFDVSSPSMNPGHYQQDHPHNTVYQMMPYDMPQMCMNDYPQYTSTPVQPSGLNQIAKSCQRIQKMISHTPTTHTEGPPAAGVEILKKSAPEQRNIRKEEHFGNKKPPYSYIAMISMALDASANKRRTLREIVNHIEDKFPYYKQHSAKLHGAIKHNLTLNDCFVKAGRRLGDKGCLWTLDPEYKDMFEHGSYQRRRYRLKEGRPDKYNRGKKGKKIKHVTSSSDSSNASNQSVETSHSPRSAEIQERVTVNSNVGYTSIDCVRAFGSVTDRNEPNIFDVIKGKRDFSRNENSTYVSDRSDGNLLSATDDDTNNYTDHMTSRDLSSSFIGVLQDFNDLCHFPRTGEDQNKSREVCKRLSTDFNDKEICSPLQHSVPKETNSSSLALVMPEYQQQTEVQVKEQPTTMTELVPGYQQQTEVSGHEQQTATTNVVSGYQEQTEVPSVKEQIASTELVPGYQQPTTERPGCEHQATITKQVPGYQEEGIDLQKVLSSDLHIPDILAEVNMADVHIGFDTYLFD